MSGTYLGGELPTLEEQKRKIQEQELSEEAIEIASMIRQALFDAYQNGEIRFDKYCTMVKSALAVDHLPPFKRQIMFGAAIEAALECSPPKRNQKSSRSSFKWKNKICYDLVELVHEKEDLPKIKVGKRKKSAFSRASEILNLRGIKVTESAVFNAWSDWPKAKSIPLK